MLFRQMAGGNSTPLLEDRPTVGSAQETIVRRAGSGRIYTIEVSADFGRAGEAFGARVVQMAAMNRTLGICRGTSREDVLRKAAALIDAAMPCGVPRAA